MIRVPQHFYQQSIIYRYLTKQENYKRGRALASRLTAPGGISKTRSQVNFSDVRNQPREDSEMLALRKKGQSGDTAVVATRQRTESMNVQSQQPLNTDRDEDGDSNPGRDAGQSPTKPKNISPEIEKPQGQVPEKVTPNISREIRMNESEDSERRGCLSVGTMGGRS